MARTRFRLRTLAACLAALACLAPPALPARAGQPAQAETIVLIRHGEKPPGGLGQLDCQGLNRALALPAVIKTKFGVPAAIFAPNPGAKKHDASGVFYYVRPLATIEPAAIEFGLPVNVGFTYDDIAGLQQALVQPEYHRAFVLVAWEHKQLVELARHLLTAYGANPGLVPGWDSHDFDGIFVIRIAWDQAHPVMTFATSRQGLGALPSACPSTPAQ